MTFKLFSVYFLEMKVSLTLPEYSHQNQEIDIVKLLPSSPQTPIHTLSTVPVISFIAKRSSSESYGPFNCHVSLVCYKPKMFFRRSFVFHDLDTFEEYRSMILKNVPQFGVVLSFFMIRFRLCIFWQEYQKSVF